MHIHPKVWRNELWIWFGKRAIDLGSGGLPGLKCNVVMEKAGFMRPREPVISDDDPAQTALESSKKGLSEPFPFGVDFIFANQMLLERPPYLAWKLHG